MQRQIKTMGKSRTKRKKSRTISAFLSLGQCLLQRSSMHRLFATLFCYAHFDLHSRYQTQLIKYSIRLIRPNLISTHLWLVRHTSAKLQTKGTENCLTKTRIIQSDFFFDGLYHHYFDINSQFHSVLFEVLLSFFFLQPEWRDKLITFSSCCLTTKHLSFVYTI